MEKKDISPLSCTLMRARTMETQCRHKSKKSENLGRSGRQNMLRPYQKIWNWDLIFGCAAKDISLPGIRSPWFYPQISACNSLSLHICYHLTANLNQAENAVTGLLVLRTKKLSARNFAVRPSGSFES